MRGGWYLVPAGSDKDDLLRIDLMSFGQADGGGAHPAMVGADISVISLWPLPEWRRAGS